MIFKWRHRKWLCNEGILDFQISEFSLNVVLFGASCTLKVFPWPFYHDDGFFILPEICGQLFLLNKEIKITRTVLKSVMNPRSEPILLIFFSQIPWLCWLLSNWALWTPWDVWGLWVLERTGPAELLAMPSCFRPGTSLWSFYMTSYHKDSVWGEIPVD